jgi:hypothetical protein
MGAFNYFLGMLFVPLKCHSFDCENLYCYDYDFLRVFHFRNLAIGPHSILSQMTSREPSEFYGRIRKMGERLFVGILPFPLYPKNGNLNKRNKIKNKSIQNIYFS